MAERGFSLLLDLAVLERCSAQMPEGYKLRLPPLHGWVGWLKLVYETGRCYSTDLLHAEPGFWNRTGCVTCEEESAWDTVDGTRFPAHPFYEELRHDLFLSSAEAIYLWLDPWSGVNFSGYITDSPISLPEGPEENGPARPDSFWLFGKEYKAFSPKCWTLLECLWGKESVSLDQAVELVYGHDAEKESAITSAIKRLGAELLRKGCPAEVHKKNGHVYLSLIHSPTQQATAVSPGLDGHSNGD